MQSKTGAKRKYREGLAGVGVIGRWGYGDIYHVRCSPQRWRAEGRGKKDLQISSR